MEQNGNVILSVRDLNVKFTLRGKTLHAIRGVSLDLYEGETLAVVGESGSGKSVLNKTFMGLLDKNGYIDSGSILFEGQDLTKLKTEKEWEKIRGGRIAMVMQDPMTCLNPLKTIGWQIAESIRYHQGLKGSEAKAKAIQNAARRGHSRPGAPLSSVCAMSSPAVCASAWRLPLRWPAVPKILHLDEPTTALDVTIQAQIIRLISDMQKKYNLTVIYITHDLGVVAKVADRVAVMYAGDIVEIGTCREVFYDPKHPYVGAAGLHAAAGCAGRVQLHPRHAAQPVPPAEGRRLCASEPLRAEDRLRIPAAVF